MSGEPAPAVDRVMLVAVTVPAPRSVASEAHEPPVVVIVTVSASMSPS